MKAYLALTVIACLAAVSVAALSMLQWAVKISSTAQVKAVAIQVYSNPQCTSQVDSIDWGVLEPGEAEVRTVYVKNVGNVPVALSMTATDWSPLEAEGYINFTWNREGAVLTAGAVCEATFVLAVSPQATGITTFTFTIEVVGSG